MMQSTLRIAQFTKNPFFAQVHSVRILMWQSKQASKQGRAHQEKMIIFFILVFVTLQGRVFNRAQNAFFAKPEHGHKTCSYVRTWITPIGQTMNETLIGQSPLGLFLTVAFCFCIDAAMSRTTVPDAVKNVHLASRKEATLSLISMSMSSISPPIPMKMQAGD